MKKKSPQQKLRDIVDGPPSLINIVKGRQLTHPPPVKLGQKNGCAVLYGEIASSIQVVLSMWGFFLVFFVRNQEGERALAPIFSAR